MRGAVAAGTLLGLLLPLLAPRTAVAYDASIGWQPTTGAAGYTLYVRYGATGASQPTDVGLPPADADGLVRVVVGALPLGPTTYFSVAAYDASRTAGAVSQQLSITYAQAAAVSDTDGDGLTDAEEDSDLDGTVDAGETDPRDADSDGDGFTDGSETLVHASDPLDSSSLPSCTGDCSTTCASNCDDANPCTLDRCELGECLHLPATAPCDDGLLCTSFDVCQDGACVGADNCVDGGVCDPTLDACKLGDEVWIVAAADATAERRGAMTSDAAYAGGDDADPAADSLAAEQIFPLSTSNSMKGGSGDEVRYQVSLPSSGPWYLWGRFYWPGAPGSNDANSFVARVDGGPGLKLGNNRDYFREWHWGGNGAVETGIPSALSLGQLSAGVHTLVIEKREAVPVPPRLDLLVLTSDATWRPSDDAAIAALGDLLGGPASTTTSSTTTTTTTLAPPPPPPSTTTTTLPAECARASDCAGSDACTTDSCVSGKCVHTAASSGSCDDGDPCTVGDACAAGVCTGWALDCSHLDGPCTYGVCDAQIAECTATQAASGTSCDDGSACTTGDVCSAGMCSGVDACASGTFCEATTKTCKPRTEVWVAAAADETATFSGAMTSGPAYADGDDADGGADSLEPSLVFAASSTNDMRATSGDVVSYVVELPAAGRWYMWGRFYYPGAPGSNDANSFFVRVDAGAALKFGNNKDYFRRWHWDGDGRYESGTPVALPLGQLAAGTHTLAIAKREVTPLAPRLDVFVLTQDPAWVPTE